MIDEPVLVRLVYGVKKGYSWNLDFFLFIIPAQLSNKGFLIVTPCYMCRAEPCCAEPCRTVLCALPCSVMLCYAMFFSVPKLLQQSQTFLLVYFDVLV